MISRLANDPGLLIAAVIGTWIVLAVVAVVREWLK